MNLSKLFSRSERCVSPRRSCHLYAVLVAAFCIQTGVANAAELITNGGFEAGGGGWFVANQAGGNGSWFLDNPGSPTPISGRPTSPAGGLPHGAFYAVTDSGGPGTHALEQSFTVAAGFSSVILSFDLFVNDWSTAGPVINPAGLTFLAGGNQHARVDILSAGSGAFDTGATVLNNYYLGVDAGPDPHAFFHYVFDITALVGGGGTFDLRFAEVNNLFTLNMGVDNVSVLGVAAATVPEPTTLALVGLGLIGLLHSRRRRIS